MIAIASFFFLRFICVSLVIPHSYGIVESNKNTFINNS